MEGTITLVLTILNDLMRNMEIVGGVKNNRENQTPSPYITALEKKWQGELREVAVIVDGRSIFSGGR